MSSTRIRSFADLDIIARHAQHVLTLFSGGLDSTYVLKELAERRCRVTALVVDVGDGIHRADLHAIAQKFGASLEIVDAQEEFISSAVHRTPLASVTLSEPMQLAILNDEITMHDVTPVHPIDPQMPAYRDVLVVAFTKVLHD